MLLRVRATNGAYGVAPATEGARTEVVAIEVRASWELGDVVEHSQRLSAMAVARLHPPGNTTALLYLSPIITRW